jgi:alpha-mannosidase
LPPDAGVLLFSRMPMRNTFFTRALLGASLFGLSLYLHAEDLPETPYDESQQLACEHNPLSSIQVVRDSIQTTQPTQESATPFTLVSLINHHELLVGMPEWSVVCNFAAPAVIAPLIRC